MTILSLIILLHKTISYITLMYIFSAYILLMGFYLFSINADLFGGFLWVIDFNLLFIFLLFGIYLVNIFKNDSKKIDHNNFDSIFIKFICIFIFAGIINIIIEPVAILSTVNLFWIITYINYYVIYTYIIKTNLFILYLTYFKLNIDLFIIINFILFFSIILVIYLYVYINYFKLTYLYKYKHNKYEQIQKHQNYNTQKYKFNSYIFF